MSRPSHMIETPILSAKEANINNYLPAKLGVDDQLITLLFGLSNRVVTAISAAADPYDRLVMVRQTIKELVDEDDGTLSKLRKDCDQIIGAALDNAGQKAVTALGYVTERRAGSKPRRSLSVTKLLENNVTPEQIEKSFEYGEPGKPTVAVRKIK